MQIMLSFDHYSRQFPAGEIRGLAGFHEFFGRIDYQARRADIFV